MALPVTVKSVASSARDAAIASLQQLLRDRLSTATPVREQPGKDVYADKALRPGGQIFATDVCVPRLAECIVRDGERHRGLVSTSADCRPCGGRQLPLGNRAQSE